MVICSHHLPPCIGRGCLLTGWIPWGRRPGPLTHPLTRPLTHLLTRPLTRPLAARILGEERSLESESWRSQQAQSAPRTQRQHLSTCQQQVFHLARLGRRGGGGLLAQLPRLSWTGVGGRTPAPGKTKKLINISQ